jgi:hypothetical protein
MSIEGVTGVEPVGAALTIGIKGDRGFPTEKDRFHIMEPREGSDGKRGVHPSFTWWAQAPPEMRRLVRGILVGPWDRMLRQSYRAQVLPGKPQHPGKRPACVGDGRTAERFDGQKGPADFRSMPCPGEACPYRKRGVDPRNGKETREPCTPSTLFLFRIGFTDAVTQRYQPPTPVVRFASNAWRTYRAILGLRESLDRAAEQLGLPMDYDPTGFRFSLLLTEAKGAGTKYPTVVVSPDESAVDFLLGRQRLLSGHTLTPALTVDDGYEGHLATRSP